MANMRPLVHSLYEPSTETWQYVVVDQQSRRCVVINPVHDRDPDYSGVSTKAPDAILGLVRRKEYCVDWLLETKPGSSAQTAVYYLRMQLSESQDYQPRTCGGTNVASLKRIFARKYGSKSGFTTNFDQELDDGDILDVGNMQVKALRLDGPEEQHLGYVIGECMFGVHYFTHLNGLENVIGNGDDVAIRLRHLWLSMARVLSFSPRNRIYFDTSSSVPDQEPFTTIHDQRSTNKFANMGESDFVGYWKGQRNSEAHERPKSRRDLFSRNQRHAIQSN